MSGPGSDEGSVAGGTFVRVTAAQSERDQRRVSAALHAAGLGRGDRLAILSRNDPAVIAVALGALRSGIVPVMVNVDLTAGERQVILDDARPAMVLDGVAAVRALVADAPGERDLAPVGLARPMHYTSGTTGRPKGVWTGVLDESDARSLQGEEDAQWGFRPDDRNLVCSPLYHSAPLRFAIGTLLAGGTVTVLSKFGPELASAAIHEHEISTAFMAPAHLQRIFSMPADEQPSFASFRLLTHAGAPCPAPLKERAVEVFPEGSVWEFYGATEGQFTACSTEDWRRKPGSVGRARTNRSLRIDDATGAIWCKAPSYARFEYWGDPDKTASVWKGDEFSVFDLGRLDDEGYLFLDGRRDDLLITGGVNVYPLEVEIALTPMPGAAEVAVFGMEDERWGQRVCAAVVRDATPAGAALDERAVHEFASSVLAPYKRPKDVWFVDAIPHSPTGKVRRSRLAADLGIA